MWLKPGIPFGPKTKFNTKRAGTFLVLAVWLLVSLACARTAQSENDYAATALAQLLTAAVTPTVPGVETGSNIEQIPLPVQVTNTPIQPADPPDPQSSPTPSGAGAPDPNPAPVLLYNTQAGDTLKALAARFAVTPAEITSPSPIPAEGLFSPKQLLVIPNRLAETTPSIQLLPDSEIVFSPSAVNFDIGAFVLQSGGYLSTYREELSTGFLTGAQVIQRVAIENSVNPRVLLALLEYQSHWVYGQPNNLAQTDYPLGHTDYHSKGLYKQLSWAVQHLSIGYYGWRAGLITEISFKGAPQGSAARLAPTLNAGTVALQVLFAQLYNDSQWGGALYSPNSFPELYERMFDNPWTRAQLVEPLYPPNLIQPKLELPFAVGKTWSLTGGPHSAWGPDGALAAIDFAPASSEHGCVVSTDWVRASASGLVVRSENGVVTLDLDGDGYEQTGWVLLYLHISRDARVAPGTWVDTNDQLGHPSCEGGVSTGTHTHMARKFNGEWILADGPIPFNLSGWVAHNGDKPYLGSLTRGDQTVTASQYGSFESRITRTQEVTEE